MLFAVFAHSGEQSRLRDKRSARRSTAQISPIQRSMPWSSKVTKQHPEPAVIRPVFRRFPQLPARLQSRSHGLSNNGDCKTLRDRLEMHSSDTKDAGTRRGKVIGGKGREGHLSRMISDRNQFKIEVLNHAIFTSVTENISNCELEFDCSRSRKKASEPLLLSLPPAHSPSMYAWRVILSHPPLRCSPAEPRSNIAWHSCTPCMSSLVCVGTSPPDPCGDPNCGHFPPAPPSRVPSPLCCMQLLTGYDHSNSS